MNFVRSNNLSKFENQRFSPRGCKDIGILKFEFVAKVQLLFSTAAKFCK